MDKCKLGKKYVNHLKYYAIISMHAITKNIVSVVYFKRYNDPNQNIKQASIWRSLAGPGLLLEVIPFVPARGAKHPPNSS